MYRKVQQCRKLVSPTSQSKKKHVRKKKKTRKSKYDEAYMNWGVLVH